MATSIGQIGLDLVVNEGSFRTQMSGIQNLAKKAGAALAGAFAVKKIADFGKSCLDLGSDLAEVQNVVDVTFPNMSAQVDKFAQSALKASGLSETMAKQYTGTFGAMAKAFGFNEKQAYDMGTALTSLTADVASFYNLSQDEAYTKLKSVFTGETESLKDLGVVMTQTALDSYALANGYGKTTSQMTEAEKVSLRYAFVQQQLSAASGDFARTSGSWANQVRVLSLQIDSLKASIGQGLINLFTPIIQAVNTLLGKLVTLANAFKAFTELITGNKNSGGESTQIAAAGTAASDASTGLQDATNAANDTTSAVKKTGNAAQKAAKQMRSLMGFDKIQKLSDSSSSTSSSGDNATGNTPSAGTGNLGSTVDFGNLAKGDTVIDKTDKKLSGLLKRCKELAAIFKKGFKIGFGNSEKKIESIIKSIKSIRKNLKEIFSDPSVTASANKCAEAIIEAFGKSTGSMTRIGITIADNLIGGVDKYLEKSKEYIKKRIVSIFDVTSEIAEIRGNFDTVCADIFDVFSGDDAKGITADIIEIFNDAFLGVADLTVKFVRDIDTLLFTPVIQNTDKITQTLEGSLARWKIVFDTLAQSVTETFDKINQVYDQYFKPFIDSIAQGLADISSAFLDTYNTYISPALDYLADKFSTVWSEHIQPALNGILELLGKVFENLQALWENLIVPFIDWIVENIMPILGPIIAVLGGMILDLFGVVGDVITGATNILGGFLDFCTGAFTGNFGKCWQGIGEIVEGFQKIVESVFGFIWNNILQPFDNFLTGIFEKDWSKSFGIFGKVLNGFFGAAGRTVGGVKKVLKGLIDLITGSFTGNWKKAWEGIKEIFAGIWEGLSGILEGPINLIITAFNAVIGIINGLINKINSISFRITVPDWVPGVGGKWWGFNGFGIPNIGTIPYLAQGGYVKPNTPQLAVIGDNRHQGEVVAPENKLKEMAMAAVQAAGSGVSRDELESIINRAVMRIIAALADMGFYLDSEQVGRATRVAQAAADRRFNTVEVG